MLIGINELNEIKQINVITDETLTQIEVDRETVFGGMSDFMILNYKYTPYDYGYSISPNFDYETIRRIDMVHKENVELKGITRQQDLLILETDLRIMDIEFALEDIITNPITLGEPLSTLRGTSYDLLLRMVEEGNYTSKEQMLSNIQKYYDRGRITEEEYNKLRISLYPELEIMPLEVEEEKPKKTRKKKTTK